jgi:hypothetical protein
MSFMCATPAAVLLVPSCAWAGSIARSIGAPGRAVFSLNRRGQPLGTHDRLGADIAAATRPVVDKKLLAEALR